MFKSNRLKKIIVGTMLAFSMVCSLIISNPIKANEAISNPDPVIDIMVNVPADYPGTFQDFKSDLEQQLIEQGLEPGTFRIISSAMKIDTTDTSGWYVYDHYLNQNEYNKLGLDSSKQPFRQADNSSASGTNPTTIEKEFAATTPTTCRYFIQHIASSKDAAGKAKMIFAGYGTQALVDYMIYPAPSDARRTFSFDIDAKGVGNHTLEGTGFFINSGIVNGKLNGYLLFYQFTSQTAGNIYILKINNIDASAINTASITALYGSAVSKTTFSLDATTKKSRIDVDLQSNKLTVQQRNYKSDGTFSELQTLFGGSVSIPNSGYNGFGPMIAYKSHGCSELTSFVYSDLEMTYEANAFDALKNTQYSEKAEYKYFINLTGTNNDPSVPEDEEAYLEGIKRLNQNEIFYISNTDDGNVLTKPTDSSSGIGPDNGLYATDANYVNQIAEFIAKKYNDKEKFIPVEILQEKDKPISDFIIVEDSQKANQVLTVHLQHLKENSDIVKLKIRDKSKAAEGKTVTGWKLKVYDPDNSVVLDTNSFVTSPDSLKSYTFNKDSKQGKYIFELIVKDSAGIESSTYQTFVTAYKDTAGPNITANALGQSSKAKITLTDQGWGIDSDGVTLIENQGSGVLKYQVNDGNIITLDKEAHSTSFDVPLTADNLTITSWDECGNSTTKTFTTFNVAFDGNIKDDYYVLSGDKLGVLPDAVESDNPNEHFAGWADESDNLVGPETIVSDNLVLHPVYTTEKVTLTFTANGGSFADGDQIQIEVPKGSLVIDHLLSGEDLPTKTGYNFSHWTLNSVLVTDQKANGNLTLQANWSINSYKLKFDANGGALGKLKEKTVNFGSNIKNETLKDEAGNNYQGTSLPTREGYIFKGWAMDVDGTDLGAVTMPAEDYTVYAVWQKDTSKYIVHFDSNGGSQINDKSYASSQNVYGALNTPSRSGYTFDGWYDEASDKKAEGDVVYSKTDHTLTAHWIANTDTQYKIQYFVKGDNGYQRLDELTENRTGTTDSTVSTLDSDIKGLSGYWYNPDLSMNVTSGTVTGDGKLVLKLYYDRYFNINTEAVNGVITPSASVKEYSSQTVTWSPNAGHIASRIIVDGIVRDDLLSKNSITFNDIASHHEVSVIFSASSGDQPDMGNYYTVKTKVVGDTGGTMITPTMTVLKGKDHKVEWQIDSEYYITSILVDGKEYPLDTENIDFKGISANHEVIITVDRLPSIGGNSTLGYYTLTVNQYGGDTVHPENTVTSPSKVVQMNSDELVTWEAQNGYRVYQVFIDGVKLDDEQIKQGNIDFKNISANHVVDVYFTKDGESIPSIYDKDSVKVITELIGGPGTITGGSVVEKGSSYDVEWNPVYQTTEDKSSDDYATYVIDKVVVNGQEISKDDQKVQLENIDKDQKVEVYLKPDLYHVKTIKYGNGTISESKTLYREQDYEQIIGQPGDGTKIVKIVVDGEVKFEAAPAIYYRSARAMYTDLTDIQVKEATDSKAHVSVNAIQQDHIIEVYFANDISDLPQDDQLINVTGNISGGVGAIDGTGKFHVDPDNGHAGSTTVTWDIDSNKYEVTDVKVNGVSVPYDGNSITLENLNENKDVEVIVKRTQLPNNDEVNDLTPPDNTDNFNIITEIVGGPGTISNSTTVTNGANHNVNWSVTEDGYEIRDIIVDGVSRPDLISDTGNGNINFDQISSDHDVKVVLGKKPDVNIDVDGDGKPDVNIDTDGDGKPDINIDTNGDGKPDINIDTDNTGVWKPSGQGGNKDDIWKPDTSIDTTGDGVGDTDYYRPAIDINKDGVDDNWKPNQDVYPNGIVHPGYDTANPNINIDINGDGKPDVNIDTDGDGKPNVNIDTDGDNQPDVNIDTDGDGKPNVNIDTNGDGKPNVNIDTDGDGKPDVNIDTDGDGKPNVNIDTNGDGKPDVNIDTDGDGKPNVNIDTNGDGKPDVNIDTDGDGKPNINIDTDGDGKPNVNIDTDGDGKPDVNIDTDGDGKPDVNIDTDGDGKPNVNIDTDGDGKPNVNIDIDGDGKPDTNIDADGDGKPDVNIDSDYDGIVDITITPIVTENDRVDTSDRVSNVWAYLAFLSMAGAIYFGLTKKKEKLIK